jgi:hypothetical protein
MKRYIFIAFVLLPACSTLDQSIRLGMISGTAAGLAAVHSTQNITGRPPTTEESMNAATLGLGLGIITSYFIHKQVADDRLEAERKTELYFGDLPPSPFVLPTLRKGGSR